MLHSEDPLDDPLDLTEPGRPRRRLRHAGDHADACHAGSEVLGKAPEEDRIRRRFRFEGIEHEVIGQHHGERTGTTQRSHEAVLRQRVDEAQRGVHSEVLDVAPERTVVTRRPAGEEADVRVSPDLGWRLRQHEPGTGQRPAPRASSHARTPVGWWPPVLPRGAAHAGRQAPAPRHVDTARRRCSASSRSPPCRARLGSRSVPAAFGRGRGPPRCSGGSTGTPSGAAHRWSTRRTARALVIAEVVHDLDELADGPVDVPGRHLRPGHDLARMLYAAAEHVTAVGPPAQPLPAVRDHRGSRHPRPGSRPDAVPSARGSRSAGAHVEDPLGENEVDLV